MSVCTNSFYHPLYDDYLLTILPMDDEEGNEEVKKEETAREDEKAAIELCVGGGPLPVEASA